MRDKSETPKEGTNTFAKSLIDRWNENISPLKDKQKKQEKLNTERMNNWKKQQAQVKPIQGWKMFKPSEASDMTPSAARVGPFGAGDSSSAHKGTTVEDNKFSKLDATDMKGKKPRSARKSWGSSDHNDDELGESPHPSPEESHLKDYNLNNKFKMHSLLERDQGLQEKRKNLQDFKEDTNTNGVEHIDMRNPAKQRNIEGFDLGRCLGSGASAVVREAINPETGQKAAIKIYDRFEKLNPAKIKNILAEVDNMARLSHPHIVKLLSYKECAVYVYVLMEFGGNMSLLKFVEKQKNNRLTEEVARPIIKQIISALDYCLK